MPVFHLHIDVEFDFQLVGITCHEKDYRLVWAMNRAMGWCLERKDNLHIGKQEFPLYSYFNEEEQATYSIATNKSVGEYIMTELSHYDFLLKIENAQDDLTDDFFRTLRSLPLVVATFPVVVEKLKMKHNLLWT